jgi:hypothetical protein
MTMSSSGTDRAAKASDKGNKIGQWAGVSKDFLTECITNALATHCLLAVRPP